MRVQLEIADGRVFLPEAAVAPGSEISATGVHSTITRHDDGPHDPDA